MKTCNAPFLGVGKLNDFELSVKSSDLGVTTDLTLHIKMKVFANDLVKRVTDRALSQPLVVLTKDQYDNLIRVKLDNILTEE